MVGLSLSLLGPFHITLDTHTVASFGYDKVRALLAYLAVEAERPHRREALAELLWPEQPAATARHSLSQALTTLRRALGDHAARPPYLLITRDAVQWNQASTYALDVATFTATLDACERHAHSDAATCAACAHQLEHAVARYTGDFLAQFTIGDSAAFEEWAQLRRAALQQRMLGALAWLSAYHVQRAAYTQAAQYVQRQLALDPWREDAHRQLMRVLVLGNRRAAALQHYEQCRALLADELGLAPEAATTQLAAQIRAGAFAADVPVEQELERQTVADLVPRQTLPAPTTPLVGRERESAALTALLADPTCRLISLVGPGGIGKTRLAQHVAHAVLGTFAHGVVFVALAPVPAAPGIVAAIAEALQLQFFGQDAPLAQLCAFLQSKALLLVLDNVEHLLAGAPLLAALLEAAPALKLLTTSRERLNLRGEWVYEVAGLRVPAEPTTGALESYSAVQLWLQSARRVQAHYELHADERPFVAQICRLTGGMPLALELAAAWVAVLPCAEIAREIARNLDFLAAATRDVPPRHRSVRAVVDHSWNLLGAPEQRVFRRLSLFRGGFSRAAAERIADASLASLAALVAKSLVRRGAGDRYELHELLRQYGAAKLQENDVDAQQTRTRHAAFYADFVAQCAIRLKGRDQQAAIQEMSAELENIRVAWSWALAQHDVALIGASFEGLWLFYASHGYVGESASLFEQAIECLERMPELPASLQDARDLLWARLSSGLGPMYYRLGHVERARTLLAQSVPVFRRIHAPRDLAFALHHLAATQHLAGAYSAERALLRKSIALSEAADDPWLTGYSRNDLGLCLQMLGDDAAARRLCAASLAGFEALDDRRGMAFALNNLGVIAAAQGSYAAAERLHRESLALRRGIDDRWGTAMSLLQLGVVLSASDQLPAARATFLAALRTAYAIRALPLALDILVDLAEVVGVLDGAGAAEPIIAAVRAHPTVSPEILRRVERRFPEMDAVSAGAEVERPPATRVDAVIAALLAAVADEAPSVAAH